MSSNLLNETTIYQIYNDYQARYNLVLPELIMIKYDNLIQSWAQFKSEDLYAQKYILYIDFDLVNKNQKFIKQILYHEFTHLTDSLSLLDKTIEEFENIMISYSEFHSAKREMVERLEQIEEEYITLQTEITHVGILTIESFMKQSFEFMKNDLDKMSKNNNIKDFFYETNRIYYFYGYVNALNTFHLDYKFHTYTLSPYFFTLINKIQIILLQDNVFIDKLLPLHLELEKCVKEQCIINSLLIRK